MPFLRTFCGLVLSGFISACAAATLSVDALPVPLNEDDAEQRKIGRLTYLGGIQLEADDARFGGYSGLWISPDGHRMIAVGDTGDQLRAGLVRDKNGAITALTQPEISRIAGADGKPLPIDKVLSDSEGVSRRGNGDFCVSFERRHRVLCYPDGPDPLRRKPVPLALPAEVKMMSSNSGLEAIGALPNGQLLALSENFRDPRNDLIGWILDGKSGAKVTYAANDVLSPVDLAPLPNGDMLIVERHFSTLSGVTIRVGRIDGTTIRPGARLVSAELARLRYPVTVDNLEAAAVWQREGADGPETLIHLLSDDNFNFVQRTLLLTFRLD